MDKSYIPKNWDCQIKLCSLLMLMMEMDLRFARSDSTCRRLLYSSGSFDCSSSNYHVIPFNCSQDFYLMFRLITYPSLDSFHFSWAQFHNQGFTSLFILIISDQISNDLLCCSDKYNWCLCTCLDTLYILLLTCMIILFEVSIILPEFLWIKLKPD